MRGPRRDRPRDARESVHARRVLWGLALVGAAGVGFVCARATLQPPAVDVVASGDLTVTVVEATVGRSVPYVVRGEWTQTPAGAGASEGVVTTQHVDGAEAVIPGTVVYTVDLRPVVVGLGEVPSFRDLSQSMQGRDVGQVQALLRETGHLTAAAGDGIFDEVTASAVREWQRSLGVEADGIVRAGDVVYLPSLPARIVLDDEVGVGSRVSVGQPVLDIVSDVPELSITVSLDEVEQVTSGPLRVALDSGPVEAVVASTRTTESGDALLVLAAPDGSALCGDRCADVPRDPAAATYRAERVVVPEATGSAVPTSAVRTSGDGTTFVTTPAGERRAVEVRAQGDGLTVVEGVDVGDEVRLIGSEP